MIEPTEELDRALVEIGRRLDVDLLAELRAVHQGELKWHCAAHSEGQNCCVDFITGDWQ